jgi:uncharacterized delta-60 repeat protein
MITFPRHFATPWRRCLRGPLAGMVLVLLWLVAAPRAGAAPGDLDPSFGGTGIVTTPIGDEAYALALTVQSDGKLVVAGGSQTGGPTLARYNTDGTLDTSFGGGTGIVVTGLFGGHGDIDGLVQQPDGKLVTTASYIGTPAVVLARYNTDGTLDASFGGGTGIVQTAMPGPVAGAGPLVLQPDGKLVVAGLGNSRPLLVRYNSDGTLDTSFGGGTGIVTYPIMTNYGFGALVVQPDGKLVAAGEDDLGSLLVRYNGDGTLDTSFGGDPLSPAGSITDRSFSKATALVLQPDGKLVAAGVPVFTDAFALARYTTDGRPDTSFGLSSGIAYARLDGFDTDYLYALVRQPDGKLVAAGTANASSPPNIRVLILVRYNPDGTLDTSFGRAAGITWTPIGFYADASALAQQPDGKLVVAGSTGQPGGPTWLALARYLNASVGGVRRPTVPQRCAAAKVAAAGKKSRADLTCRAKGAGAGGPPDPACLLKAQQAFDTAFSRAERSGGCVAPGDAGPVAAAIDQGVADLAADATGQCTAGCVEGCSGSFETCRWNGQTCGCGGSLGSCAAECSLIGTSGFCANAGDVCDLGTCSCVAASSSLACDAQKLEATGKEFLAELLCQANTMKSGSEGYAACITKAETRFGHAFDTAEKAGGCAVTGNASGVEGAIVPWWNVIIGTING